MKEIFCQGYVNFKKVEIIFENSQIKEAGI